MKTAFAYWDNRIAPVFDTARQIHVVEVQRGTRQRGASNTIGRYVCPKGASIVELGDGVLVCGAISRPMYEMVVAYGIQVVPLVAGDLREVIQAWLKGDLGFDAFAMPGCRGRRRRMCCISKEEYEMNGRGRGEWKRRRTRPGWSRQGRGSIAVRLQGALSAPACARNADRRNLTNARAPALSVNARSVELP
jgi:predicted Fe-Mo cluster-binding NifX family protein